LPLARAVGLADVVGFTPRTADLGAAALADFVQGFEATARDVVAAHGGRVIKTVGDALLFVADDPDTGARVALGLVDVLGPESEAPLRVGLVWGRVLARFGDIFGPTVALAARLCDQAGPGRVLVDEDTAAQIGGRFLLDPLGVREVPGIGDLRPVLLIAEL
ncbi:MAG TPA: adenylate/guanylate cyclase domain-containing protein, partial [Actinotalea sp.]|nr:adenylate/guanylate cyclase domain-containing protein [Actinotalea sp.]